MSVSFFRKGMEKFAKVWDETTLDNTFKEHPPGRYEVSVEDVREKMSKTGKEMVTWKFKILKGEYEGEYIFKNSMIDKPERASYLKKDILRCEVEAGSFHEREKTYQALRGILLDVEIYEYQDREGKTRSNV